MVNLLTDLHCRNMLLSKNDEIETTHCIWLGNFNRHHPHWDNLSNTSLFTSEAMKPASVLINAVADIRLKIVLSDSTAMHRYNVLSPVSYLGTRILIVLIFRSILYHWTANPCLLDLPQS